MSAQTAAFDSVAAQYDELWTGTATGMAQRSLVWRYVDSLFQAGERLLDIGCGTGADAAHFTARGVHVLATDASLEMVRMAEGRGGFRVRHVPAQEIAMIHEEFDGALSNFGALNCVDDLPWVARQLAAMIRPGGRLATCTIGRFCAWESLYYACRLEFGKARRRWAGRASSSLGVSIEYPTASEMARAFAPEFVLQKWVGIGLLAPPSYVRLPDSIVRVFGFLDRALAHLPLLRGAADHRLFILVRR